MVEMVEPEILLFILYDICVQGRIEGEKEYEE
jgi:hypothetical protein